MKKELKAELSLVGVTMIWGAGFPIMSLTLRETGPYTYVAFRSLIGAFVFALFFRKKLKEIGRREIIGGLLIAISLAIGNAFQVLGLVHTTPSKAAFITGLSVIFVPILVALIYKKLPNRYTVIAIFLAIAGLLVMSYPSGKGGINIGDVFILLCAIFYSFQILLVDKYGKNCDAIALTCVELIFVSIFSLFPGIALEGLKMEVNVLNISALLFTAIFGTAIGMGIQNKMQPYTNPSHAAVIYLGEPVFSAFFSIFIGDILSGRALAGCILVLAGMLATALHSES